MKQERKAQVVTVAVLAAAVGFVLVKKANFSWQDIRSTRIFERAAPKPDPTPQDAIYAMLDAARVGDMKAYMASYTGQMATSLQASLAETTEAGFTKYLRDSNAAIKGVAIAEPQTLTDREVRIRVEYVYADRNEAQLMFLEKTSAGWKIARVDGAERVKTLIPYGTPVQ